MKNFRIQIRYHGYYADFNVECKDDVIDIENSILDKLGENEVKFEKDGFTNDSRPIQTKEVLGVELGAGV